jgi:hypothetical protein
MLTFPIKSVLAVSPIVVLLVAGLFSRSVKLGEEFSLKPKEEVVVAEAGLEIRLEGVGHQTFSNPQPRGRRASYVQLTVTSGGQPRSMRVESRVDVGEYIITVIRANPFRINDGPSCTLVVTQRKSS